jgi:luciferase family oxidoreductase group 1
MPSMPRLSVLDQSPISEGSTGVDALRNTIDLARLADRLGYHRYWVSEHHGTPMLAGPSPEALIGPIAAATSRLRVGSGGVMLPHYSPLKVAESFSLLAGLFPERIDLAVGRASGTDPTTTFALQRDRRQAAPDDFPHQLDELVAYLGDTLAPHHPFAHLSRTLPGLPQVPEPWLLGSSPQSGIWAAELGLPYAFADFISPGGAEIMTRYRQEFAPSRWASEPRSIVSVWVVCAETDDEARRLASSSAMAFTLLQRGELIPVPPIDRAIRFLEEQPPRVHSPQRARRRIVGSPSTVREGIEAVAAEYSADEVMVVTITFDHGDRRRSYELVADAFDLSHQESEDTLASATPTAR